MSARSGSGRPPYLRATGQHPTIFATDIADLTPPRPARLLDVIEGRSAAMLGSWLAERAPDWRAGVDTVSLDPFRATPPRWPPTSQQQRLDWIGGLMDSQGQTPAHQPDSDKIQWQCAASPTGQGHGVPDGV
jgi:hypothetical protein